MKKNRTMVWMLGAGLIALLLANAPPASAAQKISGSLQKTIETSDLPGDAKQSLLARSQRAVAAGVPADDVEVIVSRGLARKAEAKTIGGYLDTMTSVQERKLPVRPVADRIEQGLAKGVAPEKITVATERLSEKLSQAQPLVNDLVRGGMRNPSDREKQDAVETVARALEKSISKDIIVSTGKRVSDRKGSVVLFDKAVRTMTNLTDRGMSAESASSLVQSAVERGQTEKDLTKLERTSGEEQKQNTRINDRGKSGDSGSGRDRGSDSKRELRDNDGRGSKDSRPERERDSGRGGGGKGK